jgi:hypothetical protein
VTAALNVRITRNVIEGQDSPTAAWHRGAITIAGG